MGQRHKEDKNILNMFLFDPFYYLSFIPYLCLVRQLTFKNCVLFCNLELHVPSKNPGDLLRYEFRFDHP